MIESTQTNTNELILTFETIEDAQFLEDKVFPLINKYNENILKPKENQCYADD